MKYLSSEFGFLFSTGETRTNLASLLKYFAFLAALVTAYAVLFHLIMRVEGQQHSWITGFYWTLVVMTTLGFGDITFTSDLGRFFSIIVLLSGVVFLLVMLPFLFIRLFYAPWLETRVRLRAPREVERGTSGHVIITEYDAVAVGLVERLKGAAIPYFIVEPDPVKASRLVGWGRGCSCSRSGCRRRSPARRLAETGIGSRTGLSVVAVEAHGGLSSQLSADHVLPSGGTLLMLGSAGQRRRFAEAFEGR